MQVIQFGGLFGARPAIFKGIDDLINVNCSAIVDIHHTCTF